MTESERPKRIGIPFFEAQQRVYKEELVNQGASDFKMWYDSSLERFRANSDGKCRTMFPFCNSESSHV
jgi:hypothetical protein